MGESGKGVRVEGEEKWKDEIEAEKGFFPFSFLVSFILATVLTAKS